MQGWGRRSTWTDRPASGTPESALFCCSFRRGKGASSAATELPRRRCAPPAAASPRTQRGSMQSSFGRDASVGNSNARHLWGMDAPKPRSSTPEAEEVHGGRPAPTAAATWSTQHVASSWGVEPLRGGAMTAARSCHRTETRGNTVAVRNMPCSACRDRTEDPGTDEAAHGVCASAGGDVRGRGVKSRRRGRCCGRALGLRR